MNKLLESFWKWLNKSPQEYAIYGAGKFVYGRMEDDFPRFEELLEYAKSIVDKNILNEEAIDELFTIMALDNESEIILDYIDDFSSEEQLKRIIDIGINHMHYQGRWQLAELLYRRRLKDYMEYLLLLSKDGNPCVSKRASNCISYIAEEG